jgi:hypothetical protein
MSFEEFYGHPEAFGVFRAWAGRPLIDDPRAVVCDATPRNFGGPFYEEMIGCWIHDFAGRPEDVAGWIAG